MGFHAHDSKIRRAYDDAKIDISKELSDHFRPEFLNRLDKTIYFEPLGERAVAHIVVKELELLSGRVAGEGYTLTFKPAVIDYLVKHGYDPHFGARPLKRAITEYIEDKLADLLLSGFVARQSDISVDVHAGKIIVTQKKGSHVRTRRARQRM
ncbi:ATP-dependent Clp protease ATP-binding subunit, partial [Candidatus Berkelbacteria bacterium]|nr:ATP-dependent Clp protease ATP-binding subunit [Candidatus Berkelbacteria bacterium]